MNRIPDKFKTITMEAVRFGIVGVMATGIHWGIYYLLLWATSWGHNICYSIGYIISFCGNLWMSSHFTFNEALTARRGLGFALSHLCNYLLHIGFLNFFIWLGIGEKLAPIPTLCIVVPINFILVRTVFKSNLFKKK